MREIPLLGRLLLRFNDDAAHVAEDLSAAVRTPDGHLWVAADEHGCVERLTLKEPRIYADHTRFHLADHVSLDEAGGEIDIEAMDYSDGNLWVVGSHSSKRKKPKGKSPADDLQRLAEVIAEPSRFLLARVPVREGRLAGRDETALSARLRSGQDGGSLLLELLANDAHLAPFLRIPGKDNGFDVEGMVVAGDRVLLGLRGPVLRGYALVIELQLTAAGAGLLEPRPFEDGRLYRKHFLDLDGLGIRELSRRGDDLLILAGPTMALAAPHRLFLLPGGVRAREDSLRLQEPKGLQPLLTVNQVGEEKSEGVALFSWFGEDDSVMVLYDTPAENRRYSPSGVFADVFRLELD